MGAPGVLVVGASQAGVQIAATLREKGYEGPVTLVGAESHVPYQRPPLSKAYLLGQATRESLALRAPSWYEARDVELILGERVVDICLQSRRARTDTGRQLAFDRLALTTGARIRRLEAQGAGLPGVFYLRDLVHADELAVALHEAQRVVVVGGGFIGLEAAGVCRSLGKQVTVVETAHQLMGRAVAPVVSTFFRRAHEHRGTRVLLGRGVVAIEGGRHVCGVALDDGTSLTADLVLVGVGVEPRLELAEQLGLRIERGAIGVDAFARSSVPDVVAAGDATVFPNPQSPEVMVRLESVQNAIDQAKIAAATLAGCPAPYRALPWFWSDQAGIKLQIAGLSHGWHQALVRGRQDEESFCVLYLRDGNLLAVDAINRTSDYMAARRALSHGTVPLSPEAAADDTLPLKELLASAACR